MDKINTKQAQNTLTRICAAFKIENVSSECSAFTFRQSDACIIPIEVGEYTRQRMAPRVGWAL